MGCLAMPVFSFLFIIALATINRVNPFLTMVQPTMAAGGIRGVGAMRFFGVVSSLSVGSSSFFGSRVWISRIVFFLRL